MYVVLAGGFGEVCQALAVRPDHVDLGGIGHEMLLIAGQQGPRERDPRTVGRPCRVYLVLRCSIDELRDACTVGLHHKQIALLASSTTLISKREFVAPR